MQIVKFHSHLNGLEHILVHHGAIWKEIGEVVGAVDASRCRTKVSQERTKQGRMLYSPIDMNAEFKAELANRGWAESRTSYYVTDDTRLIRQTLALPADEQKQIIQEAGRTPIYSYNQTDFVKDRIEIEVQFGKYAFVAYDLFVKHMAFFIGDMMDVGIEILPVKELQAEMSSGVPYYEGALYDLLRQGRSTPPVPLVLVGIGV